MTIYDAGWLLFLGSVALAVLLAWRDYRPMTDAEIVAADELEAGGYADKE